MKNYVALIFSLLLGNATISSAAPIIFFGEDPNPGGAIPAGGNAESARNSFLSQLIGVGNQDFESFTDGDPTPLNLSFPGSSGAITAIIDGGGTVNDDLFGGRFATSGSNWFEVSGDFDITFSDPIAAFGFYGTDIGDFDGRVTLELGLADGGSINLTVPNTIDGPNGSLLFYGFIDPTDTYTSITFGNTNAGTDFFGFDDMVIGDPQQVVSVPEPTTLFLLSLGLSGLGLIRSKKA